MPYRDRELSCPGCRRALVRQEVDDRWTCASCAGVLVGEAALVRALGEVAPRLVPKGALELRTMESAAHAPSRPCPICASVMPQVWLGGEVVERCHADQLVWFDREELDDVLRAAEQQQSQRGWLRRVLGD